MASLFNGAESLLRGVDKVSPASLEGKTVGVYFSAHWCPPCRGFTPKLAEWYKHFKANHPEKDNFEVVFVSSDRDQAAFDDYYKEMPWLGLPFSERDMKSKLSEKFKVQGIPTFVIVNAEGDLITKNGRSIVSEDPKGENFPWNPKPISELLGEEFVNNKGEKVNRADLSGKYVGLYFSAHWCPPCKGFTPELVKTYNKITGAGKPFEVVFVSSDNSEEAFKEYHASMPWLAIPYGDKRKDALSSRLEVSGIPTFVVLDPEGNVVTDKGRAAVAMDPEGVEFPWTPKPLNELTGNTASSLNDSAVLIAFTTGEKDQVESTKAMLKPIAEEEEEKAKAAKDDQIFFMYTDDDDSIDMVRDFARLPKDNPLLVILDIPKQVKIVAENHELTADNVRQFLADFKAGKLQDSPIK